jgi:hypothetical protein
MAAFVAKSRFHFVDGATLDVAETIALIPALAQALNGPLGWTCCTVHDKTGAALWVNLRNVAYVEPL